MAFRFTAAIVRRTIEMLVYPKVGAISGISFPVKFTDRLRLLNRYTAANAWKSGMIAKLIDLIPALGAPIFGTLADHKVDLAALVADDAALEAHIRDNVGGQFHVAGTCRMGAAHDRQSVSIRPAASMASPDCASPMPPSCRRSPTETPCLSPDFAALNPGYKKNPGENRRGY
jgi:5-(hydroxymethyl)furfural/furfural oxidase